MYRCAYVLFRTLELRDLELTLCTHSDTVSQYLEQTIRDAHPVFVACQALVPPLYLHSPLGIPIVLPTVGSFSLLDRKRFWTDLCSSVVKSTFVSLRFSFFFVKVKSLLVTLPSSSRCDISEVLSIVYSEIAVPLESLPNLYFMFLPWSWGFEIKKAWGW